MRPGLLVLFFSLAGCDALLGGLDEGTARNAPRVDPDGGIIDATSAEPAWLTGYPWRTPIDIEHGGASVDGYQVRIILPTAALVAAGKLRPDGADIRIALPDGRVIPHWVEGGLGTSSTVIWTRLDLRSGTTRVYLYYGKSDAEDQSSVRDTFVSGVIQDLDFDSTDAWHAFHGLGDVSRTNEFSTSVGDGKARLRIVRKPAANGARIGLCQTVTFPAGSSYRLVFDVDVLLLDRADVSVIFKHEEAALWCGTCNRQILPPRSTNIESRVIDPMTATLCFEVSTEATTKGQGVDATFSTARLRRFVENEPIARPSSVEEVAP